MDNNSSGNHMQIEDGFAVISVGLDGIAPYKNKASHWCGIPVIRSGYFYFNWPSCLKTHTFFLAQWEQSSMSCYLKLIPAKRAGDSLCKGRYSLESTSNFSSPNLEKLTPHAILVYGWKTPSVSLCFISTLFGIKARTKFIARYSVS